MCVAFQILGVPQNRKGPSKGHWGQHRFLIHISPPRQSSPLNFLSLFLLAVQLHLLKQEPSYLIHSSPSLLASKYFFHCILQHLIIYLPLYPPASPSWMLMTLISPATELHLSQDYRLQGAPEGFTFPENPNLSNLKRCWDACQHNLVFSHFFLLKRGAQPMMATRLFLKKRKSVSISFLYSGCALSTIWSLPLMLRPSKPARINISS